MFWSDPPASLRQPPGGYGKVAQYILDGLPDDYKVGYTPMGKANRMGIFRWKENLYIYPSGNHDYAEDVLCNNTFHMNADLVFALKDLFCVEHANTFPLEFVWYVPVDYEDMHPHVTKVLNTAFRVIAMSEFGRKEMERQGIKVDTMIRHGVDLNLYKPVEGLKKEDCRRFFSLDENAFYVGFIGMNRQRKMVWRANQVFRRLLDTAPDANIKFVLWTDVFREIPLLGQMAHLGITDKVYWPGAEAYNTGIPENMMYQFYNACDVIINVSGEGFWLPGVEAMACGIPTIVVDYAAAPEVAQFTAKMEQPIWPNQAGVKQPLVDLDDMVKKILKVYNTDWQRLRKEQLERAKLFDWNLITPQWVELFESCKLDLLPKVTKEGTVPWNKILE